MNIEAPATILKLVRANGSAVGKTIEDAIRELAEAGGSASLRDARWVPKPAPPQTTSEPEITEVTRREIVDRLGHRNWAGRLQEDNFLSRLYDLNALPSEDKRFQTAAGDIWQHRVNNNDGEGDWVFYDRRFNLLRGADEDFLRFLCETVHPVVRPDTEEALELVGLYNVDLRSDGWELVRSAEISGRPVFRAQQTTREVEIFNAICPVPSRGEQCSPNLRVWDSRLWAFLMLYSFGVLPIAFPIYAAPLYLSKVFGLSQGTIGKLIWLPPLGWELGYVFAGWICDKYLLGDSDSSSFRHWLFGFAIFGTPLAIAGRSSSLALVMSLLSLAMFAAGGFLVITLRYRSCMFPSQIGLLAGLSGASWSGLVAVVMPMVGRWFDHAQYRDAFDSIAAFPIVGFFLWWSVMFLRDRSRSNLNEV